MYSQFLNLSSYPSHRFLYCHNYDRQQDVVSQSGDLFPKKPKVSSDSLASKDEDVRPLRMMDVFAGVGGLSIGLEQAGVAEAKWAIEYVKDAANAFKVL